MGALKKRGRYEDDDDEEEDDDEDEEKALESTSPPVGDTISFFDFHPRSGGR